MQIAMGEIICGSHQPTRESDARNNVYEKRLNKVPG